MTAQCIAHAVTVDGAISSEEWPGTAVPAKEQPNRYPVTGPPATIRVAYDKTNLYVAVTTPVQDAGQLVKDASWGGSDGLEVCIRRADKTPPGPTFVLHGFLNGVFEPVRDAGTHMEDIYRLNEAVQYAAQLHAKKWTAEWRIPFEVLDVTPRPGLKFGFNVGVRRMETNEWLVWAGALGPNWQLDNAGTLVLE